VFLGRDRELDQLLAGLEDTIRGSGGLYLISGEQGIGKSRLADELAARARHRGAQVLWGRCWEAGGAPPYWPWIQAIRSYLGRVERGTLRSQLGQGAPDLAQMVPELREVFPDLPELPSIDPETARFRLFDATSAFLRRASRSHPVVVVLDDLQAADVPSLLLLRFLTGELGPSRILLVGAFRDPASDHPLIETVLELERQPVTHRLELRGLGGEDVARFIESIVGVPPAATTITVVHGKTDGNPLFLTEVVRLLVAEDRWTDEAVVSELALPDSVRAVIGRRLRRLSPACVDVLRVASVLGRDFSLEALKGLTGRSTRDVLERLDEAARATVVTEAPGGLGRLRFSHELVRDTLYEGISLPDRYALHGKAVPVLEEIYATNLGAHLAELAHHAVRASAAGEGARAVEYARRAAKRAGELLAFEEASRLYELALEASKLERGTSEDVAADLLLALGDARARSGDLGAAKRAFREAAEIASRVGRSDQLARAALGYGGRFVWARAAGDPQVRLLLERALIALGDQEPALRARVMARLAGVLRDEPEREPRWSLSAEALSLARDLGDPATLAYTLEARYAAIYESDTVRERLAIADEMARVAQTSGDKERWLQAHGYRYHALLELGDIGPARSALQAEDRITEELAQPAQRWLTAVGWAALALFEGRFEEAEQLASRALTLGERAQSADAQVSFRLQTYALRREQGRLDEVEEAIRRSVDDFPWYPMFRSILADVWVRLDRKDEAGRLFEELARDRFAFLPRDSQWLFGIALLAEVARALDEAGAAAVLYELLVPYADHNAYSPPDLCTGSVSRPLGIVAWVAGRSEDADRRFVDALKANARMGARPWLAYTQYDYARMLVARGAPGDDERTDQLLTEAVATCRSLGMTALERESAALLGERARQPARPTQRPPAARGVFRLEGDSWVIAFEGEGFRLKDAKGLRYIHRLLTMPGREVHVADLVSEAPSAGPAAQRVVASSGMGLDSGHAGEVLDEQARSAYLRRIEDLRQEIEEATAWGDPERAARAKEELDFLSHELGVAYGLGGRARKGADTAERMRKAVGNRIRASLGRISKHDTRLGRHLANAIAMGTFCSYRPDREIGWEL
jgi:hypothetical protein